MGAMYIGQQFLQNVLGYSTLVRRPRDPSGRSLHGGRRGPLSQARAGARLTLYFAAQLCRSACSPSSCMLLMWKEDISYWKVALGYVLIWASASGSAARPPRTRWPAPCRARRAGMASGTADLQRDLGGAFMQSIFGAFLTAGFAAAVGSSIAASPDKDKITDQVQAELTKSFSSAADTAE